MGDTSFLVRTDPESVPVFVLDEGAWRLEAVHLPAMREALRMASKWLRREWRPDFSLELPFGYDRHPAVRRSGEAITITGLPFTGTAATHELEFNHVELPQLRVAIDRYLVWFRRRSVTTTQGGPHGQGIHPDR